MNHLSFHIKVDFKINRLDRSVRTAFLIYFHRRRNCIKRLSKPTYVTAIGRIQWLYKTYTLFIKAGVLQGSMLGSCLYSISITDLPISTTLVNKIMHADDTILGCDIKDVPTFEKNVYVELCKITNWLQQISYL